MADIFEKGINDLNNRDPIIILCGEVGSMVRRFSEGNLSESKTTEDLIDVYHTKFDGKEDYFKNILLLMKRVAKELPSMSKNGSFVSKALLNTILQSLMKDDFEDIVKFYDSVSSSLDEYMSNRRDEFFISKVMEALSSENKEEKGSQDINPKADKFSFTINEVVKPDEKEKAKVEEVKEDKKEEISNEEKKEAHHLLWHVLDNIDEKNAGIVSVENDNSENAEEKEFNGKTVFIGDKSKLNFNVADASVSVGNRVNTLNISHKKDEEVPNIAMTSSVKGVVDYMEAKAEIPFEFKINTKSDEFKRNMVSTILLYVRMNEIRSKVNKSSKAKNNVFELAEVEIDDNNSLTKADKFELKGKVSTFNIDGMVVSYDDFAKFKTYDDFVKFEEKREEKEKEEVHKRLLRNELVNNVAK